MVYLITEAKFIYEVYPTDSTPLIRKGWEYQPTDAYTSSKEEAENMRKAEMIVPKEELTKIADKYGYNLRIRPEEEEEYSTLIPRYNFIKLKPL